MSVLIKSFGNNNECNTKDDLVKSLKNDYANMSVTLVNTKPSGIQISHYVDVASDGSVTHTYNKKPVDLALITA